MLTFRYINGMGDVLRTGNSFLKAFLPYVATLGQTGFEQGQRVDGYLTGKAWNLFNVAGREINYTFPLGGSFNHVVFRMYVKTGILNQQSFLRFQNGTGMQIVIRLKSDGKLEAMRGGAGDNANLAGALLATSSMGLALNTWHSLEVRADLASSLGVVRVWLDNSEVLTFTGNTGSMCDQITIRGQGSVNMTWDHVMAATDTVTASTKIGLTKVVPVRFNADYIVSPTWTPNGGTSHAGRFDDSNIFAQTPDDDTTYLSGSNSSDDDLYTVAEPVCDGLIRAVTFSIAAKALSGTPQVQPRILFAGVRSDFGAALFPESSRYAVQRSVLTLDPAGEVWTTQSLIESAFGIRGAGAGTARVSLAYLEQAISLAGDSFDCGGQPSFII